jgi:hypothetical protein
LCDGPGDRLPVLSLVRGKQAVRHEVVDLFAVEFDGERREPAASPIAMKLDTFGAALGFVHWLCRGGFAVFVLPRAMALLVIVHALVSKPLRRDLVVGSDKIRR